jgi:hypothetical protein
MGVYAEVIAEHTLETRSAEKLGELLAQTADVILQHREIWDHWGGRPVGFATRLPCDEKAAWQGREGMTEMGLSIITIEGPYKLRLEIGPRFCVINPTPKWGALVSDPEVEAAVTAWCHSVAICVGATKLVYLPDSAYCPSRAFDFLEQDMPLEAIIDWLSIECGPPASCLSSIYHELSGEEMRSRIPNWNDHSKERIWDANGYFVANVV